MGIPARLSSFWEILENAVPFTTGSCRKRKPDFWVEWKAPLLPRLILTQVGSRLLHLILKHAEVKKKTKQDKNRLLVVVYNAWGSL